MNTTELSEQAKTKASNLTNSAPKSSASNSDAESASLANAIDQIRAATTEMYHAFNALGLAGGSIAKDKMNRGKKQALDFESKMEETASEKPLLYIGAAFAAGWLVSRFMK